MTKSKGDIHSRQIAHSNRTFAFAPDISLTWMMPPGVKSSRMTPPGVIGKNCSYNCFLTSFVNICRTGWSKIDPWICEKDGWSENGSKNKKNGVKNKRNKKIKKICFFDFVCRYIEHGMVKNCSMDLCQRRMFRKWVKNKKNGLKIKKIK